MKNTFAHNREDGGSILIVVMVVAILVIGMGTYLTALGSSHKLGEQRILDDRALMAAEAGMAAQIAAITNSGTPPGTDETQTYSLPAAQYAPFQNVTVATHVQASGGTGYWTVAATAVGDAAATRSQAFARRVQATLMQENFSRYELFINDFGGVWSPGYVAFIGLGAVYLGPVNINSGTAFFPNFWSLGEITSAAPKGIRTFADWSSYLAGVYGKSDANDYVNILQDFSSTYSNEPKFYGGLRNLPAPIPLPNDMGTDPRADELRRNAGLVLPDGYSGYDAAAGPNFVIDLVSPGSGNGPGTVQVRQYLGTVSGSPTYGPTLNENVSDINGAMIVKGNVVSMKGVLSGRLTIGVFKDPDSSNKTPTGNMNITGSVQYQSRIDYKGPDNEGLKYTDAPEVFTSDGKDIDQSYVDTLQGQLDHIDDILGIVVEGNVMIEKKDLDGSPVANDLSKPIYIDAVVMATGASTLNGADGGFGVEGDITRPPGHAYFLGGMIQNKQLNWSLYDGSGITNGIALTQLWDKRASEPGGAPPFFPVTGNFGVLSNSWRSSYVAGADDPVVYPTLP